MCVVCVLALVFATGMKTRIGRIAALLTGPGKDPSKELEEPTDPEEEVNTSNTQQHTTTHKAQT